MFSEEKKAKMMMQALCQAVANMVGDLNNNKFVIIHIQKSDNDDGEYVVQTTVGSNCSNEEIALVLEDVLENTRGAPSKKLSLNSLNS